MRRIRESDEFKKILTSLRAEAYERVIDLVCASAQESVQQLLGVVKDNNAPASARVSASRTILEYANKYYDEIVYTDRLEALEKHFERMGLNDQ